MQQNNEVLLATCFLLWCAFFPDLSSRLFPSPFGGGRGSEHYFYDKHFPPFFLTHITNKATFFNSTNDEMMIERWYTPVRNYKYHSSSTFSRRLVFLYYTKARPLGETFTEWDSPAVVAYCYVVWLVALVSPPGLQQRTSSYAISFVNLRSFDGGYANSLNDLQIGSYQTIKAKQKEAISCASSRFEPQEVEDAASGVKWLIWTVSRFLLLLVDDELAVDFDHTYSHRILPPESVSPKFWKTSSSIYSRVRTYM